MAVGTASLTLLALLLILANPAPVSGSGLSRPTERHAAAQSPRPLAAPHQLVARQVVTPVVRLTVTPPRPTLTEAIIISAGGIWRDACVPIYKTHQVTANRIKINAIIPLSIPCGQALTPWTLALWLDPLPAGAYTVDLLLISEDGRESFTYTTTFTVILTSGTRLITSAGGALAQYERDQRATVVVPPGGVVTATLFTMSYQPAPTTTDPLLPIGHVVALTATPTSLTKPLTLTLRYSDTLRGPVIADTVQLYRLQSGQWVTDGITITARLTDGLTAQITQLSRYGLLGRTNRLYFPVGRWRLFAL
ncbi:MAG: hypothetical protein DYG89_28360 [Caldilinea sp. CFX5]|nr:hypothetical protein [Caldilinea sp. CFX5]